jgi:hypothetical protein
MSWVYSSNRRLPALTLGACSAVLFLAGPFAWAESSGACLRHPAKLSDTVINGFSGRPAALLDNHPSGGVLMSAAVRRLAGSSISTVPALVSLAKDANVSQIVAIGVGLARAANVCRRLRPDLALRIKEEVQRAAIAALTTAFEASLTSDQFAAMGAPEVPGTAGGASTPGPQGPNAAENLSGSAQVGGRGYVGFDLGIPQTFFGNGGIRHTVVSPVSPAR